MIVYRVYGAYVSSTSGCWECSRDGAPFGSDSHSR